MYNDRIQRFTIGESTLAFRHEDVALIMGLHCDRDVVSFKHEKKHSVFEQIYLDKMHNRHRDAIKAYLLKLIHNKDCDKETFVKLLVVYLITTILFPNISLNAPIWAARYADNLSTLGRYAWVHATHRWLMANIPTTSGPL